MNTEHIREIVREEIQAYEIQKRQRTSKVILILVYALLFLGCATTIIGIILLFRFLL